MIENFRFNDMEEIKLMTREQIADKLRAMKVGEDGCLPIRMFSFIVINPDYDPDGFDEEIEKSEKRIDQIKLMGEEIRKPYFDWVFNNTLLTIPKNSKKWLDNHSKICPVSLCANRFVWSCVNRSDGTRDYYSEELVEKIASYGDVVDFC